MIFAGSQATRSMITIFADTRIWTLTSLINLPSFPVLTSPQVHLYEGEHSRRIINVLSSISSAPALASIDIQYWGYDADRPTFLDMWNDLDGWLAQVARHTAVERGLVLRMRRWTFTELSWEPLLLRFVEDGGEIKAHADGWINYNWRFGDVS